MMKIKIILLTSILFLLAAHTKANNDSLVFKNGTYMVGELKSMDRGVLTFETDYSDSDFKIEWKKVSEVYSDNFFLISGSDGYRYNGSFQSIDTSGRLLIKDAVGLVQANIHDIVYIKSLDEDFWSRLYASIDMGFNLTKANNLRQFNATTKLGYFADLWSADASINSLLSRQDEVDPTKRTDANGTFNWFLPKDWYIPATINFLSNTEQKLDLRINGTLGFGKYVLHTNQSYWGFSMGGSYNNEKYTNETDHRKSWEGYLGSELNLYDIGDLNLQVSATIYQGLTDFDRFRSDIKFDVKYDLPLDFYIKMGVSLNYDNQPAEGAGETDYVIQTGLGWEL